MLDGFLFCVEYPLPVSQPDGKAPLCPSCDLKSTNSSNIPFHHGYGNPALHIIGEGKTIYAFRELNLILQPQCH